jgi:hypothetical protein
MPLQNMQTFTTCNNTRETREETQNDSVLKASTEDF